MNSIILSGFMCCGKTTVGKQFCKRTGMDFFDLDAEIENKMQATIPEIFRDWGEKTFREQEAAILRELCKKQSVIASGGGALIDSKNYGVIKLSGGFTVFINTPFELCYKRILRDGERPLAKDKTREELEKLYNERLTLYRKNSDAEVDGANPSLIVAAEIMEKIIALIDEKTAADIEQLDAEEVK
jgi:shikimate kinase